MMRVKKTSKGLLLMLFFAACACLFLARPANEPRESVDEKQTETIEVARTRTSLPAMTVITHDHINDEMVSKGELPAGKLVSPLQVVGRVLAVPVVEGQVLTESCFVAESADAQLVAQIPHGMRAVTVSVSSRTTPDRKLLYPGCVVDVLVDYRLSSGTAGRPLTMLRGIQVIAVADESVVSNPNVEEEGGAKELSTNRGTQVTLLVTSRQAEALQLALENGRILLSIRNPLDRIDRERNPLNDYMLGRSSIVHKDEMIQPTISNEQLLQEQLFDGDNPRWEVTVIRGRSIQRISSGPASSRQQPGLSPLSMTDENGDKWILDLARRQSLSSLKDSNAKSGPPLLVKTDVQIRGRNVSISLIVEGQAGEKYIGGVRKNRQRQPAPGFNIVDEAGKVLTSGRFRYG